MSNTVIFPGGPGHEPVEPPPLEPEVLPALNAIVTAVTSDDETDYYQAIALTLNLWEKRQSYDANDPTHQRFRRNFELDLRAQLVRMRSAIVMAMAKHNKPSTEREAGIHPSPDSPVWRTPKPFYVRAEGVHQATPLDSINNPRNVRIVSSWEGHGEHTSYPREGTPLGLVVCLRTHIEACAAM
jgi:hypothetical protein